MSDANVGNESFRNISIPCHSHDMRKCSDISGMITEECGQDCLTPGSVLHFCKKRVLLPYLRLLALTGLRTCPPRLFPPIHRNILSCFGNSETDGSCCAYFASAVSLIYLTHILVMMVLGHIIQYMTCFQPIGGFHSEFGECGSFYVSVVTNIIPALMQLAAHCHILWLFRVQEMERLPNLMERVFLLSGSGLNGVSRHNSLVHQIWFFILSGAIWGIISIAHLTWLIYVEENFEFSLLSKDSPAWVSDISKVVLIIGMGWQEVSKAAIITSYCIHAHLLAYYSKMLRCSLIYRGQSPLDWMREMTEFQGLLTHFNDDLSPSAVAVVILAIIWAVTGVIKLISSPLLHVLQPWTTLPTHIVYNDTHLMELPIISSGIAIEAVLQQNISLPNIEPLEDIKSINPLDLLSILMKILLAFVPLIQAARVTSACRILRDAGHIVRARPFAYRNAPPSPSLDSLLLYTSSLRLSATLLPCVQFPVSPSCLCISIIICLIVPLLLLIVILVVQNYKITSIS